MKSVQRWKSCGPVVRAADLADLERQLSCRLPIDYKRFLVTFNGGEPRHYVFPIRGLRDNPSGELRVLRSVAHTDDVFDLVAANKRLLHALPDGCISIGDTASGDQLILYVTGPRCGEVWFYDWYSRYRDVNRRVYFVAKTFKEFVDGLRGLTKEEQADMDRLMGAAIRTQAEEDRNPRRSRERPVGRRKEKPATMRNAGDRKTHKRK